MKSQLDVERMMAAPPAPPKAKRPKTGGGPNYDAQFRHLAERVNELSKMLVTSAAALDSADGAGRAEFLPELVIFLADCVTDHSRLFSPEQQVKRADLVLAGQLSAHVEAMMGRAHVALENGILVATAAVERPAPTPAPAPATAAPFRAYRERPRDEQRDWRIVGIVNETPRDWSWLKAIAMGLLVCGLIVAVVRVHDAHSAEADAYYPNCAAARAAGAAPIMAGEPGYRPALDRDHDGIACE